MHSTVEPDKQEDRKNDEKNEEGILEENSNIN